MQRGRVGDREIRAKMAEIRMVCGKEIEIRQHRTENAVISIHKSLQSIKSSAQETVSNEGKIGILQAQLRAVEDDLVKAISVKTRKEAKKMTIADSISAARARIEELNKIVVDQRTRKEEYAEIISHQSEDALIEFCTVVIDASNKAEEVIHKGFYQNKHVEDKKGVSFHFKLQRELDEECCNSLRSWMEMSTSTNAASLY